MELIDNVNHTLKEDLQKNIHGGSKLSVAAACFSIYAFQELKKELHQPLSTKKVRRKAESFISRAFRANKVFTGLNLK